MAMAGQVALRFPVVGWLVRDAVYGRPEAKYYFLANCLLAGALGAFVFGYAFVISLALVAAWVALALLVYMTAADSFSKANRRALAADRSAARRCDSSRHTLTRVRPLDRLTFRWKSVAACLLVLEAPRSGLEARSSSLLRRRTLDASLQLASCAGGSVVRFA